MLIVPDNHELATLPSHLRAGVEAAVILATFDQAALAALLDAPVTELLEQLVSANIVVQQDAGYQWVGEYRQMALAALDETPERVSNLHKRAADHYASQLAMTANERAIVEQQYMHHLKQYCDALIHQAPTLLAEVVATAPLDLLSDTRNRQLVRYYRGLGAGLQTHFAVARAEFAQLLAEPHLDAVIHARVLNSDAQFAQIYGDYQYARDAFQASYVLWCALGDEIRQGLALTNLGVVYYELQDYGSAEAKFRASVALFEANQAPYQLTAVYNELGLLYRDQGRWDEAMTNLVQAAKNATRAGATDALGKVAINMGEVMLLQGQFASAREYLARALGQLATDLHTVDVYLNLGLIHEAEADNIGALQHYYTALQTAVEFDRHDILALIHYRIGHAEQRLGHFDTAQASYDQAIAVIEATRTPIRDEGLLINLMGRWQQVYEAAIQLSVARGDVAQALSYTERARARAFADALARRNPELLDAEPAPVTAAEVQAALPPDTLLLSYFATGLRGPESALLDAIPASAAGLRACLATPPQLWVFSLTHAGLRCHPCALDPNMFQRAGATVADGQRFLNRRVLRRIYDGLVAPVADLLATAKQVVIMPHGPLHQVPFAALLDPDERPVLDLAPQLVYCPSATVLLRGLGPRSTADLATCLALGYDGATGLQLRQTEAEAEAIAQMCGGVAWHGAAGVCEQLQSVAGDYRWLHLACHGEFDLDDPLRSCLELGPDERLTAAEVATNFNLRAELVTLSACRSGVSRVLRGDEPLGLARAFLSAGARAVLVTLWPVEDTSARLLMEQFYRAILAQGQRVDLAQALAFAQRDLRQLSGDELGRRLQAWGEEPTEPVAASLPYADPLFWAAYTLIGGTIPVSTST